MFTSRVTRSHARTAQRAASRAHAQLAEDIERLRLDAGISLRELAAAAHMDSGFLARIVHGKVRPSLATYARIAVPLGADLATRLYPNTGPIIRDRHQAARSWMSCLESWPAKPFMIGLVRRPIL